MILQIFCAMLVWSGIGFSLLKTFQTVKKGFFHLEKLHRVPCDRCIYFTGDYRLKCTVHPLTAMTQDAINCADFDVKGVLEKRMSYN